MSRISINHLTFYYEGSPDYVFEDVSLEFDTDWKLGLVGRNGKGKTTLINILRKKMEYRGSISMSLNPDTFQYFPYAIENKELDTIQVVEQMRPDYEFWMLCRELNLLQIDADILYRPFCTLSFGEQTKIMLALLFAGEDCYLMIDEPTNHLDMPTRELVQKYLRSKKGFLLVSHDRDFLDGCVDHIMAINRNDIQVIQGNFSTWWEEKNRQDASELAENQKLKKDIVRLTESARKKEQWADKVENTKIGLRGFKGEMNIDTRAYLGEKSRRMQQRRKNLERRQTQEIQEKSKLLKNLENPEKLKLVQLKHHKEVLVSGKNLTISYDGKRNVIEHLDLEIRQGERIALEGTNGCGKSSVIKAILGLVIPTEGELTFASGLIISYINQDTSFLQGTLENYLKQEKLDETLIKALLRKLDFEREQFDRNLEDLSGGQKKKILIAASLARPAHLYIWDEPLNFIDIFSRMQIEELIKGYEPAMLFVEHDKRFCQDIATRVIKL